MTCRCGGIFCALHIGAESHGCTFNYRELAAKEIEENNPKIKAKKIDKI